MDITRQNFISVDQKSARNSYGQFFTLGDKVSHEDETVGEAIIEGFESNVSKNEVKALTNKGYAHIDFISKSVSDEKLREMFLLKMEGVGWISNDGIPVVDKELYISHLVTEWKESNKKRFSFEFE